MKWWALEHQPPLAESQWRYLVMQCFIMHYCQAQAQAELSWGWQQYHINSALYNIAWPDIFTATQPGVAGDQGPTTSFNGKESVKRVSVPFLQLSKISLVLNICFITLTIFSCFSVLPYISSYFISLGTFTCLLSSIQLSKCCWQSTWAWQIWQAILFSCWVGKLLLIPQIIWKNSTSLFENVQSSKYSSLIFLVSSWLNLPNLSAHLPECSSIAGLCVQWLC